MLLSKFRSRMCGLIVVLHEELWKGGDTGNHSAQITCPSSLSVRLSECKGLCHCNLNSEAVYLYVNHKLRKTVFHFSLGFVF